MQFNLLTNGIDSLRASYDCLSKLDDLTEGAEHNIKDAIMYLNHANEILFKLILKNQKEYLMFEDISAYMNAKEAMIQQGKSNVLEVKPNLRTVSFSTALKRIQFLCDISISPKYKGALIYLNELRNKIMHFEIEVNVDEVYVLTEKLKTCQTLSVEFFDQYLQGISVLMEAARFEMTYQDFMDDLGQDAAERYDEDAYIDAMEGAYEDLGEGKW